MKNISEFVNKIFESREKAHAYHFNADKFGSHIAFEEYYTKILKLLDEFVEVHSGQYGQIGEYQVIVKDVKEPDPIKYFTEVANFIQNERKNYIDTKNTHLYNITDEMIATTYRTIYKLKFLK